MWRTPDRVLYEKEKDTLLKLGIPIIDSVSMSEAKRFNYISNYTVYNYGINYLLMK